MGSEWQETTIAEFTPFSYGKGLPERRRNINGNIPVYGSNGVVGYHDVPLTDGPTVVIGRKGTVGAVHYSPEACWPIDTTFYITGSDSAQVRYCYYVLKTLGLEHMNSDSAVPGLNREAAHSRRVRIPLDKGEQHAIACILGALDDKIDLNRRMNETLEEMARAIFKSWFVDFDPVHAKAKGQQPPGLKPEIAELFPDAFEESELGEIPKGWRVGVIGDIAKQAIGGQWGLENLKDGLVPAICLRGCDMEALRHDGFAPDAPIRHVKPQAIDIRLPSSSDVLIAASGAGPCGRPLWFSPSLRELYRFPVIYSNFVKRLSTPSVAHAVYLDRILIAKFEDRTIHDYINGTSIPNLDTSGLLSGFMLIIPPDNVLETFNRFCQLLFSKLYSKENPTLVALRDTLLPKLISGELQVPDAERIIGKYA